MSDIIIKILALRAQTGFTGTRGLSGRPPPLQRSEGGLGDGKSFHSLTRFLLSFAFFFSSSTSVKGFEIIFTS